MLVVTDEQTRRVSRESSLTGTGETEEKGDITTLTLVGRRVESEDIVLDGHEVEHDGQNSLLHLTGVLGSENDHLLILEIYVNSSARGHARGESVGREGASVVDGKVRNTKGLEFLGSGTDKHVAHEKSVIGTGADNTDFDAVLGIPTSEGIYDIQTRASVKVVDGTLTVNLPDLRRQLGVHGSPPDITIRGRLINKTLVLWRATSLCTGRGNKSSGGGDGRTLLVDKSVLVEGRNRGVVLNGQVAVVDMGL